MVNKVALGILAVIILTAMTVGGLVGLQLSDDGAGEATATPAATTTATPAPATPDADGTGDGDAGTPTPTATTTPTPTPAVSTGDYNRTLIEEEVRAAINAEREERDMSPLGTESVLRQMARNHSRAMAGQGYVTHDAAGFTTADRYEAFGLADRCRIPDNTNSGIREGQALETVDKRTLGANYTFRADGPTVTLRNETVTARAAVDSWFRTEDARQKLLLREAGAAGVGVVLTERGGVYVTVDLC